MKRTAATYIVRALGVLIAAAASLLSIGLFMGGVAETNLPQVAGIWALYLVCAIVIGVCVPRHWYVAVAVAWLPLTLLVGFVSVLIEGRVSIDAVLFTLSPLAALAGGYIGSRASRHWFPSWSGQSVEQ